MVMLGELTEQIHHHGAVAQLHTLLLQGRLLFGLLLSLRLKLLLQGLKPLSILPPHQVISQHLQPHRQRFGGASGVGGKGGQMRLNLGIDACIKKHQTRHRLGKIGVTPGLIGKPPPFSSALPVTQHAWRQQMHPLLHQVVQQRLVAEQCLTRLQPGHRRSLGLGLGGHPGQTLGADQMTMAQLKRLPIRLLSPTIRRQRALQIGQRVIAATRKKGHRRRLPARLLTKRLHFGTEVVTKDQRLECMGHADSPARYPASSTAMG